MRIVKRAHPFSRVNEKCEVRQVDNLNMAELIYTISLLSSKSLGKILSLSQ